MVFQYLPQYSGVVSVLASIIKLSEGKWVEGFLRWAWFGWLVDFVFNWYEWILIVAGVIFMTRWVHDYRKLVLIACVIAYFVFFVFDGF